MFSIRFLRSVHADTRSSIHMNYYILSYVKIPHVIYPFSRGWTSTNNEAANIIVHVSWCTGAGVSLGEGVGLSPTVGGTAKSPKWLHHLVYTHHAPGTRSWFPLLPILRYLALPVLKNFASLMAVKWHLLVGLMCFLQKTNKLNILVWALVYLGFLFYKVVDTFQIYSLSSYKEHGQYSSQLPPLHFLL